MHHYFWKITAPIIAILSFPISAYAGSVVNLQNPLNTTSIPQLAGTVIQAVLGIVGSIALLMFVYGGFLWLTAAGNPDKIKQGRETMMWTAIGLAFIFSSYIIASFVIKALTEG